MLEMETKEGDSRASVGKEGDIMCTPRVVMVMGHLCDDVRVFRLAPAGGDFCWGDGFAAMICLGEMLHIRVVSLRPQIFHLCGGVDYHSAGTARVNGERRIFRRMLRVS